MAHSTGKFISLVGKKFLRNVDKNYIERLDEAALAERVNGIEKATLALREAEVAEEKIIYLLQKYWDLRLSEAKEFLLEERYIEEK